jgi:hypothetical protein
MRTFQRISRLIRPSIALPVLAVLALLGLMVGVGGCEGPHIRMDSVNVNPALQDVPVPAGTDTVKFKADHSYSHVSAGFRDMRHVYETDYKTDEVTSFYRKQMPAFGWTLDEENLVNGIQRFMYVKANETCYVSIYDDWGTKIMIQVLPKGGQPAPAPVRPAPMRAAGK